MDCTDFRLSPECPVHEVPDKESAHDQDYGNHPQNIVRITEMRGSGDGNHGYAGNKTGRTLAIAGYPEFDGGVDAGNVTVTVLVRNFSVVNRTGKQNRSGEGHIVYFKDVVPPTKQGSPAVTGPGSFQISAQTWCTWHNVSPDTHTFAVELVNNDNTPLVPPVLDAVDVTAVERK